MLSLVFVVAVVALGRAVDVEIPELSADLGLGAYETGQLLRGGVPFVALRTDDRARATSVLARLRQRGHDALAFDDAAVASSETMPRPKSFRFDADAFVLEVPGKPEIVVPFDDVSTLLRAVHKRREQTTTATSELKFDLKKAALSGGVMLTKTVRTESTKTVDEREPVLYLFRRSAGPLLFSSTYARYQGLGAELRHSQLENFEIVLGRLRERCPQAVYDDRLVTSRRGTAAERLSSSARGQHVTTSAEGVDLYAHILAMSHARGQNAYR